MMQCDIRACIIQRKSSYMSIDESNLTKLSELINKLIKECDCMHPSTNHQHLNTSKSDFTPTKRIMQAKKVQINVLQQNSR